ncbi:branched-chain amino acid ABC transporter permease [Azorhizobium oxalatiphilum]|uniref:Branched-chain amino acid ABC transporter permease n=1 Tax=Azorhizobium oxalatiphilum TaxID=980631 RepID=A0A917BQ69_9HYPH|nr:branched-chain amino acid ABC transporter permease [Azorhizobium oxalatiphilum]GGF50286.1 branched-chain amino acid ABC transporter permease [Azorhizobium oxalatiphilum]
MISYLLFIGTLTAIYALLSLGLVASWGQAGMVNLGLVGFFGLGAYCSTLLTLLGLPIGLAWVAGGLLSAVMGIAFCLLTRTLRGDYLAIVTLGFGEGLRLVELNERWLTGGSDGISGIPAPFKAAAGELFPWLYFAIAWGIVLLAAWGLNRVLGSPFGRALRAVRDDENVAAVAGKSVLLLKCQAFGMGAALFGLAGALYAHFTSYISPDNFVVQLTIYIFLAVTLGGYSRLVGAILGAVAVMSILESSRFAAEFVPGLNAVQIASLREFAIAVALIIIMQVRPQGIFGLKNEKARAPAQPDTAPASVVSSHVK